MGLGRGLLDERPLSGWLIRSLGRCWRGAAHAQFETIHPLLDGTARSRASSEPLWGRADGPRFTYKIGSSRLRSE